MEIKINKKEIFLYSIKDDLNKILINLYFAVDFIEVEGQKYLENKKTKILIESPNYKEGKKIFSEIINDKIRKSIISGTFYNLLKVWKFSLKPENEITEEKTQEILNHKTEQAIINLNKQLEYSSVMINRFDETTHWSCFRK